MEMLVVLAVIALLLTLAMPRYFSGLDRAKDTLLLENLATTRDALDKFYADQGRFPDSLDELVRRKYLRGLPIDPITQSPRTWVLVPPEPPARGAVGDLHSGAKGRTKDGKAYATF